jgi:hypothetical protein
MFNEDQNRGSRRRVLTEVLLFYHEQHGTMQRASSALRAIPYNRIDAAFI